MVGMQDHAEKETNGMTPPSRMTHNERDAVSDTNESTGAPSPNFGFPHDGEALRGGSGSVSAPPPPGFTYGPEERARMMANQLSNENGQQQDEQAPSLSSESPWYKQASQHTTSFTNLAAVLGTGLAESMDDATRAEIVLEPDDLSLARQSRHAMSRLIGAGTSPDRNEFGIYRGSPSSSLLRQPFRRAITTPDADLSYFTRREEIPHSLQRAFSVDDEEPDPSLHLRRQSTLLSIFTGRETSNHNIGVTVFEPGTFGRSSAPPSSTLDGLLNRQQQQRQQPTTSLVGQRPQQEYDLERDLQCLSVENSSRTPPLTIATSPPPSSLDLSQRRAEIELNPFMWDVARGAEPSRALIILRASNLPMADLRSTCEAFGVLDTFRSDFADRGVIFIGYFDIRSAQYAALELESSLKRLAISERGDNDIRVQYCVPLNSSSAQDDSIIVMADTPPSVTEESLLAVLSAYGSVRSLHRQGDSLYGVATYLVEYHDVQDGRQALLELESTQPFGPDVIVEVKARNAAKRKKGRELLGLIGRWRQSRPMTKSTSPHPAPSPVVLSSHSAPPGLLVPPSATPATRNSSSSSSPRVATPETTGVYVHGAGPVMRHDHIEGAVPPPQQQTTQVVVGPSGAYSYVTVNHAPYQQHHQQQVAPLRHMEHHGMRVVQPAPAPPQQIVHGPHGSYLTTVPSSGSSLHSSSTSGAPGQHYHWQQHGVHGAPPPVSPHQYHTHHVQGATVLPTSPYGDGSLPPAYPNPSSLPYYPPHIVHAQTDSSLSSASGGTHQRGINMPRRTLPPQSAVTDDREAWHLMLDVDAVESGRDTRTSLMVRNIPNKYTQQMLLSEFTENGHGPGKIDFFYLPIDFKNRCNRGYAFVNFVDYRDILPFHRQYFGQHWRVFNSDKICDITYARIQGKDGMLKRFENSALMEKDEEYKPLVFVSHGTEKGKRIPFPY